MVWLLALSILFVYLRLMSCVVPCLTISFTWRYVTCSLLCFYPYLLSFHISTISATFLFIIKIYAFLLNHLLGFGIEIIHIVLQFSISSYEGMIITFINVCVWIWRSSSSFISVYLCYFAHFFDAVCSLLFDNFWHLCI